MIGRLTLELSIVRRREVMLPGPTIELRAARDGFEVLRTIVEEGAIFREEVVGIDRAGGEPPGEGLGRICLVDAVALSARPQAPPARTSSSNTQ